MLNASIVIYHPDWQEVEQIVLTLLAAPIVERIYLIDNSPVETPYMASLIEKTKGNATKVIYRFLGKNVGYGAAHNIALQESLKANVKYHLVINSDIQFNPTILTQLATYMDEHPTVGHIMPKVTYPNGETQYLCKLLPTPMNLFGRRFLPKSWTQKQNERFELRASGYNKIMNVPYLSGCFMFLRTEALQQVGLFDERFFMYPEDIDLTRRIHQHYQTLFYPHATIVHAHRAASYKNYKYLWIHIANLCRYFNKWGWLCDKERIRVNRETLAQIQ